MREIKFKAKLSHSKQWIIGNLIIAQDGNPYIIPFSVLEPDGHHLKIDSDAPYWVDKYTVSQFTGLIDKNGKDIYEGDIYSIYNKDYCISFYSGCFVGHRLDASALISHPMGWCYDEDSECELVVDDFYKQIEIIGNIHNNPELLKLQL